MKSSLLLLCYCLSLYYLTEFVTAQCLTANDNPRVSKQEAGNLLIDGRLKFALDTLKIISKMKAEENFVFSPTSIYEALLLLYFGSRRTTENLLKHTLHIHDDLSKVDVQRFYSFESISRNMQTQNGEPSLELQNVEYSLANRLWIKHNTKLRKCMSILFNEEIELIDFVSDPDAARNKINQWVSNVTKGNIQDLIPVQGITDNTDLVLTNAVFFKGQWKSRFNSEHTKKSIFYQTPNNATFTNFMYQKGTFNHTISEELGAHVLQLPYKGDNISMFIFLPPFANSVTNSIVDETQDALMQLIKQISNSTYGMKNLLDILDGGMQAKSVEIQIPKFSFEEELPILQLTRELGVDEILTPGNADLRGFVEDSEKSLHIGDAVHRAKIKVTEEGTTASAATALFSFRSSRPTGPAIFHANHPFLYIIYNHPSRKILFNGIFRKPSKFDE